MGFGFRVSRSEFRVPTFGFREDLGERVGGVHRLFSSAHPGVAVQIRQCFHGKTHGRTKLLRQNRRRQRHGLGFRNPGSDFGFPDFGFRVSDFGVRTWATEYVRDVLMRRPPETEEGLRIEGFADLVEGLGFRV